MRIQRIRTFICAAKWISLAVYLDTDNRLELGRNIDDKTLDLNQIEGFLCGADGGLSEP
jgi:hypothetical protein